MLLRLFPYRPSSWAGTRSGDTRARGGKLGLFQRREPGNRCRRDKFSLVCRIEAAIGWLGSWVLKCPSQYPNTLWPLIYFSSGHVLWEYSAAILYSVILQMSNRGKEFHLQGQSAPHHSPHGHSTAGLLGKGECDVLLLLGREQGREGH